ncbi:MAG TPA: M10 family metallopeptidase [Amaricoccus sp.]|nr:M10 family metallopeptidase [Amaricoccus sp.]
MAGRDLPAGIDTSGRVRPEDFVRGVVDSRADHDWYRVEVDPGSYVVRVSGTGDRPLGNPLLILRDEDGREVYRDHSRWGEARIEGSIDERGTYYLDVSGLEPRSVGGRTLGHATGDYAVSLNRLDGTPVDAIAGTVWIEKPVVRVYFAPAGEKAAFGDGSVERSAGWNDYQVRRAMAALDAFSGVCDIGFRQTQRREAADFPVLIAAEAVGWSGMFQPPGTIGEGNGVFAGGPFDVSLGLWGEGPGGGLERGAYGWELMLHEFGHGLGLAHPHDPGFGSVVMDGVGNWDDPGVFGLNSTRWTVMSYREAGLPDPQKLHGFALGPMAFDIAALQQSYGATRAHDGDDRYLLPHRNDLGTGYACLWDTGGEDTIRAGRTDRDVTIVLRDATLAYERGGGGFLSAADGVRGGFTIANGVAVENAAGGDGDDTIVGNGLENRLAGGGGADEIRGGPGADLLHVGDDDARDLIVYRARYASGATVREADRIAAFDPRSGPRETSWDRFDLTAIDGDRRAPGDQPLRFVEAFTAPGQGEPPAEARVERQGGNTHVLIDLDGDGAHDMLLVVLDVAGLGADDFLL